MLLCFWRPLFIQLLYCTFVKLQCSTLPICSRQSISPISLCAFPCIITSQYLDLRVDTMPPWTECNLRLLKNVQYCNYEDAQQSGKKTGKFVPDVNVWMWGLAADCSQPWSKQPLVGPRGQRLSDSWPLQPGPLYQQKKGEMWPISTSANAQKFSWLTTGAWKDQVMCLYSCGLVHSIDVNWS